MANQALDAVLEGDRRGWTTLAGALKAKIERALGVAAIDDVAAVLRHRRADPGFDQFLDLVDDVGVGRVFLYRRSVGDLDAGRAGRVEQGRLADEVIEQDADHLRFKLCPRGAGARRYRDEVAAEEHTFDMAGGEQFRSQRRGLGSSGIGKVAAASIHHGLPGKELASRRI